MSASDKAFETSTKMARNPEDASGPAADSFFNDGDFADMMSFYDQGGSTTVLNTGSTNSHGHVGFGDSPGLDNVLSWARNVSDLISEGSGTMQKVDAVEFARDTAKQPKAEPSRGLDLGSMYDRHAGVSSAARWMGGTTGSLSIGQGSMLLPPLGSVSGGAYSLGPISPTLSAEQANILSEDWKGRYGVFASGGRAGRYSGKSDDASAVGMSSYTPGESDELLRPRRKSDSVMVASLAHAARQQQQQQQQQQELLKLHHQPQILPYSPHLQPRWDSSAQGMHLGVAGRMSLPPMAGVKKPASHSAAERRRRDRINERFNVLREIVPGAAKADKASVLLEVIEYVKKLQAAGANDLLGEKASSPTSTGPSAVAALRASLEPLHSPGSPLSGDETHDEIESMENQVTLEEVDGWTVIKICCPDREGLLHDLAVALREAHLEIAEGEMTTYKGRAFDIFHTRPYGEGKLALDDLKLKLQGIAFPGLSRAELLALPSPATSPKPRSLASTPKGPLSLKKGSVVHPQPWTASPKKEAVSHPEKRQKIDGT